MRTPQNRRRHPARLTARLGCGPAAAAIALLVLAVALSACAPAAGWIRDRLDSGDATLSYTEVGALFDPGTAPAYGVHVLIRGSELELKLEQPALGLEKLCNVSEERRYMDCSLGTVREPLEIRVSGKGWIGSASYTREPTGLVWLWAYTPTE